MRSQHSQRFSGISIFKAALLAGCALGAAGTAQAQVAEILADGGLGRPGEAGIGDCGGPCAVARQTE